MYLNYLNYFTYFWNETLGNLYHYKLPFVSRYHTSVGILLSWVIRKWSLRRRLRSWSSLTMISRVLHLRLLRWPRNWGKRLKLNNINLKLFRKTNLTTSTKILMHISWCHFIFLKFSRQFCLLRLHLCKTHCKMKISW